MPEWLNLKDLVPILTAVVALASAIAAVTPSQSDNTWIQKALDFLNALGLNVGKAKNADR